MLNDLYIHQDIATPLFEDNNAAIAIANASRPTRCTRHMDIKHFSLMDWVSTYQLFLMSISTHDNPADGFTRSLGLHLFRRHSDTLLGKRKPIYCNFWYFKKQVELISLFLFYVLHLYMFRLWYIFLIIISHKLSLALWVISYPLNIGVWYVVILRVHIWPKH